MALIFFLLDIPDQPGTESSLEHRLKQVNILGFICLVPGIICLCLVLQYGDTTYNVSAPRAFDILNTTLLFWTTPLTCKP